VRELIFPFAIASAGFFNASSAFTIIDYASFDSFIASLPFASPVFEAA